MALVGPLLRPDPDSAAGGRAGIHCRPGQPELEMTRSVERVRIGETFEVPADAVFSLKVRTLTDYCRSCISAASTTNRVVQLCPVARVCFLYIHSNVYRPLLVPSHQR